MQHDWFMYHLRSTYKNRLDFPFNLPLLWLMINIKPELQYAEHFEFVVVVVSFAFYSSPITLSVSVFGPSNLCILYTSTPKWLELKLWFV